MSLPFASVNAPHHTIILDALAETPLAPKRKVVNASSANIAERALYTMMKQQAISDLYKPYVDAKNNGIAYHQASVHDNFNITSKETFDRDYMSVLFKAGYGFGRNGYNRARTPAGLPTEGN